MSHVEQLEWDSSFFGFPIGQISGDISASEIQSAVQEADKRKLRCTYLLVLADDHALLDAAQQDGFRVYDIRVELKRPVVGHPAATTGLRRGRLEDLPQLEQIARERFRATRFFADKGFPVDRSAQLYVEWLCKGLRGEPGWIALVTDDTCGFVVCHLDPVSKIGAITLIGVAPGVVGKGNGSTLVVGAGALFADAALLTATVVTQGHNIAAQRLYQAHGYRTSKTHLWLHRWMA